MEEAEVTVSAELDDLDPGAFYTQYLTELDALEEPAGVAADGDASGDTAGETETSGNTETSGEADTGSENGGESSGQ